MILLVEQDIMQTKNTMLQLVLAKLKGTTFLIVIKHFVSFIV